MLLVRVRLLHHILLRLSSEVLHRHASSALSTCCPSLGLFVCCNCTVCMLSRAVQCLHDSHYTVLPFGCMHMQMTVRLQLPIDNTSFKRIPLKLATAGQLQHRHLQIYVLSKIACSTFAMFNVVLSFVRSSTGIHSSCHWVEMAEKATRGSAIRHSSHEVNAPARFTRG